MPRSSAADRAFAKIDRDYAAITAKAQAAEKGWFVDEVHGTADCARRLNEISKRGGIVSDIKILSRKSFVIIWWTWPA